MDKTTVVWMLLMVAEMDHLTIQRMMTITSTVLTVLRIHLLVLLEFGVQKMKVVRIVEMSFLTVLNVNLRNV